MEIDINITAHDLPGDACLSRENRSRSLLFELFKLSILEIYKKICYSCGWMITFKLPSRGWAVSRKPSTVSFNGKTWVIISVTLILLY